MRVDCHQHLWPAPFLEGLRARSTPPRLVGWTLHVAGQQPFLVSPTDHDLLARAEVERLAGTERALISMSSPLGVEHLPADESAGLLEAWHDGAAALGSPFEVWAAVNVTEPDTASLRAVLARDRVVGLQLPATALADTDGVQRMGEVLSVLEQSGRPLLVHPGPVGPHPDGSPPWWPAVVPYVAQLHAAWYAWHVAGRQAHPTLRVAFVALAGLAPLHHERLTARGGVLGQIDPQIYYETSSYGPRAVDATVRVVGVDAVVHGSDRPYADSADPGFGAAFANAMFVTNPHHLLSGQNR
ncbi:MAG: amidohydrolase [Mycobacteriaceae bacterium]